MKRFMMAATTAAMILGSAGLAMAQSGGSGSGSSGGSGSGAGSNDGSPGPDRSPATIAPSATEVQTLLGSKGYTNVSAVQTGNANGKVKAQAMKNGTPVNLEIDMNTGSVVEVK